MDDPRVARLFRQAELGQLSRRQLLSAGIRFGLATPLLTALVMSAPMRTSAAPAPAPKTSVARNQGTSTGTFTVIRDAETPDLDPQYAYDSGASLIFLATYEMLIQYKGDKTDELAPMLATSWEESPDGTQVTFTIPENVTFHDGTACDAQMVKDSFARFLLQGAGPVNVISRFIDTPDKMEVVSPTQIRFNLGTKQPLFLPAMASEYGPFIVNTKLMEENKTDDDPFAHEYFRQNIVGTGPYKVSEVSPNDKMVLDKFDEYHGGWDGSYFDKVIIRIVPENATRRQLIETGEADATTNNLTPDDYTALRGNSDVNVLTYPSTAVAWTIMNAPKLKTVDARRGMSFAFPYDDVVNSVYAGLMKRSGPIASSVTGADPNVYLYQTDLAQAKDLILSAGFAEGDTFDYVFQGSTTEDGTIAQLFQANLSQIGFNLDVQAWDMSQLNDMVYGDSPAEERPFFVGVWQWWPDYNDGWNQLAPNFLKSSSGGGGSNGGYWVNDRFEEIMAQAEKSPDQNEINTLMIEAQNILTEQDPPVIYYGELIWASVQRTNIKGFAPNPLYLSSYNFKDMYREG